MLFSLFLHIFAIFADVRWCCGHVSLQYDFNKLVVHPVRRALNLNVWVAVIGYGRMLPPQPSACSAIQAIKICNSSF